jgi:hypothetical protein
MEGEKEREGGREGKMDDCFLLLRAALSAFCRLFSAGSVGCVE